MKYSTTYQITAAQITAQYRLTIDCLLTFHENTIARYLTTLGHSINLIDLDFNGHTNNRRYVQMALVSFNQEFLDRYRPDSLNIRFLHESRMGDEIVNETYSTDVPDTFVGRVVSGRGDELCRVTSHWTPKEPLPDIADVNLVRTP